ncbi:MAG: DUF2062 domain-containing protein [Deltaproteobacteria bacterium]|nr:MAG: DUF2062 domain-containing protein [Deltaproteobacteria bacterium]
MTGAVSERIRLIGVVFIEIPAPGIETTVRRLQDAGVRMMLVYSSRGEECLSGGCGRTVLAVRSSRKDRRTMFQTAVREARRLNKTHILVCDPENVMSPADFERLSNHTRNHPDAVVIGHRKSPADYLPASQRIRRWGATFLFRLQTGIHLDDPGCPVRVYPLWVFDCLKIRRRCVGLDAEILVKAAWAGIPIRQVSLETPFGITHEGKSFGPGLGQKIAGVALHIHWIMRSITPIPHRKVVIDEKRQGQKVSIWHPLQSIRALLTENLTPVKLAWAVALGVFLGTLPLVALHTVTILLAAGFFRLNKAAALAASQLCMPPVVPALCIEAGFFMRHGYFLTELSVNTLGYQALERIWEWLLGALLLAPVLSLLLGGLAYGLGQMARPRK